jgi:hypothetical protein
MSQNPRCNPFQKIILRLVLVGLNFNPEIAAADLISAASASAGSLPLIRAEEFRKNAVKILGWELWDDPNASKVPPDVGANKINPNGNGGGI